jgi:tricorn protease
LVGVDGTDARRITKGIPTTDLAWSPDGRRIAFTRNEEFGESTTFTADDIFLMDADGSDVREPAPNGEGRSLSQPTWSPDGSQVAYVDGESVHISVVSRDGTGERQLLEHKLFEYAPSSLAWSPDGRTIAYETSTRFGCVSITFLDVASGRTRPLTSCTKPIESTFAPGWQPAADPAD